MKTFAASSIAKGVGIGFQIDFQVSTFGKNGESFDFFKHQFTFPVYAYSISKVLGFGFLLCEVVEAF